MRIMILGILAMLAGCAQQYKMDLAPLPTDQMATVREKSSSTVDSAGVKVAKTEEFSSEASPLAVVAKQNLAVIEAARDIEVARASRPNVILGGYGPRGGYGYNRDYSPSSFGGFAPWNRGAPNLSPGGVYGACRTCGTHSYRPPPPSRRP